MPERREIKTQPETGTCRRVGVGMYGSYSWPEAEEVVGCSTGRGAIASELFGLEFGL